MLIASLLLLGIPTLLFLGLCTIGANLILAVIKGLIEGVSDVCIEAIDSIGKEDNKKKKKKTK